MKAKHKMSNVDNFLSVLSTDIGNFELSFENKWTNESIYKWKNEWIKEPKIHDPFIGLGS